MPDRKMKPIHPGEVLLEDYLKPLRMSQNALAKAIGVPADRISEIVRGRRGITGDTAVRLAHYFNTTPDLWSGLQADYEIELALDRLGPPQQDAAGCWGHEEQRLERQTLLESLRFG